MSNGLPTKLAQYHLAPSSLVPQSQKPDSPLNHRFTTTFEGFQSPTFSARQSLARLYAILKSVSYNKTTICDRLNIQSLQQIQPTHLYYYHRHFLAADPPIRPHSPFSTAGSLTRSAHHPNIRESNFFRILCQMGLFIPRQEEYKALGPPGLTWFDVEGLYIATDHRYMLLAEDKAPSESPVMYIGNGQYGPCPIALPNNNSDHLLESLLWKRHSRTLCLPLRPLCYRC